MYGFTNDKSKWNLGEYGFFLAAPADFKAGITYSGDSAVLNNYIDKYVKKVAVSTLPTNIQMMLNQIDNPALIWDVAHYNTGVITGPNELTELEQESAIYIEDVFCSNDYVYVIASGQIRTSLAIRFKGA